MDAEMFWKWHLNIVLHKPWNVRKRKTAWICTRVVSADRSFADGDKLWAVNTPPPLSFTCWVPRRWHSGISLTELVWQAGDRNLFEWNTTQNTHAGKETPLHLNPQPSLLCFPTSNPQAEGWNGWINSPRGLFIFIMYFIPQFHQDIVDWSVELGQSSFWS